MWYNILDSVLEGVYMSKELDVSPKYYNGKEVKILWECNDFKLAEIFLLETKKIIVVDKRAITIQPEMDHFISINLLVKP